MFIVGICIAILFPPYYLLRHEAYHRLYFLTVARGPTMSQSDRLIWPPDHIQCIDERIAVVKQRVLETSTLVDALSSDRVSPRTAVETHYVSWIYLLTVLKQITSRGRTIRELFCQRVRFLYFLFEKTHLLLLQLQIFLQPTLLPWIIG